MRRRFEKEQPGSLSGETETPGPSTVVPELPAGQYTEEQLMRDLNYYRAGILTKKLLEKGLVTSRQYARIMEEKAGIRGPGETDRRTPQREAGLPP